MGKIILAGVLVLALSPVSLIGLPSKGQKLAKEASKLESKYEGQLGGMYEDFGTNCVFDLSGEEFNDFLRKIDKLNSRRRLDFRRHGLNSPSDYSICGGEGYGYAS